MVCGIEPRVRLCADRAQSGAQTHEPRGHDLSLSQTLDQLSHQGTPSIFLEDMSKYLIIHREHNIQSRKTTSCKFFLKYHTNLMGTETVNSSVRTEVFNTVR